MTDLEVIKKIRDDLTNKKTIIFSDNPEIDRINLTEALNELIKKEEKKCKKHKLVSD